MYYYIGVEFSTAEFYAALTTQLVNNYFTCDATF